MKKQEKKSFRIQAWTQPIDEHNNTPQLDHEFDFVEQGNKYHSIIEWLESELYHVKEFKVEDKI